MNESKGTWADEFGGVYTADKKRQAKLYKFN